MIWNISFKTYKNNEVQEEGFETSMAHDLSHVIQEVDSMFDLVDIDKIELQINTMELKPNKPPKWAHGKKEKADKQ